MLETLGHSGPFRPTPPPPEAGLGQPPRACRSRVSSPRAFYRAFARVVEQERRQLLAGLGLDPVACRRPDPLGALDVVYTGIIEASGDDSGRWRLAGGDECRQQLVEGGAGGRRRVRADGDQRCDQGRGFAGGEGDRR
jgi:hypothetical protein